MSYLYLKEWLGFFSSVTASLAWPLMIVILAIILRERVFNLLAYVEKVKIGDHEVNFNRRITQVVEAAVSRDITVLRPDIPEAAFHSDEMDLRLWNFLISWQAIEKMFVDHYADQSAGRHGSVHQMIKRAFDERLIDERLFASLLDLNGLRNLIVHKNDSVDITSARIDELLGLMMSVMERVSTALGQPIPEIRKPRNK